MPEIAEIPVIVLSARGEHNVISDALWKGATDYFSKPIDFLALLARIEKILHAETTKRIRKRDSPPATPSDIRTSTTSDDHGIGHHAALALVFSADSEYTMSQLERAITFVERTATVVADRTCRNSDGSLLVLAEGEDSQMRLQGIAREVERWFSENVHSGLRVSIGLSGPGDIQTMLVGEQFVASGTLIRHAIKQAWLSSRNASSNQGTPIEPYRYEPLALSNALEAPSTRSIGTLSEISGHHLAVDTASSEMFAADIAQARIAFRFSQLLRAQCEGLRAQCEQYEQKLKGHSKQLSAINGASDSTALKKTE
jgi:hypothetical protein